METESKSRCTHGSLAVLVMMFGINLFINSDAFLIRDALWSIQGKKHYLQAAIVGGIHHTGKILRQTFS